MKCIPTLMFLPGLLFAFATRPIPSPVDSAGTPIILVDGAKMVDGTWVVSDEQEKLWFSQDKGAHWSTVPPEGAAEDGRVVGEQVVSQSDLKFWTAESGWKSMSFPVGFEDRPAYYIRPSGDRAFYNETSRIFKYYRSNDGLKTWTEWFALDSNNVPVGNFELFGQRAIGKIWFSVPDSSKLFGTTDGATWSQVNLPENFQVFVIM